MRTRSISSRIIGSPIAYALLAWSLAGDRGLHAQVDAWAVGGQTVVMPPGTNGPAGDAFALPVPNDPAYQAEDQYQGQVAERSQHVRTTGDGRLLFFAVDGKLFDGNGYLIADARASGCSECLEPGVMEFVSVPVPGSCGMFYLFSSSPQDNNYSGSHVQWSILDLDADNPRFPASPPNTVCAKKGRLLDLVTDLGSAQYPQFASWLSSPFITMSHQAEHMLSSNIPTSDHVAALVSDPLGKSITPMIRVVESANANGDHWLFYILPDRVYVYRVAANGIYKVDPLPANSSYDYVPTYVVPTPVQHMQFFRDADAILANDPVRSDDVLVLALTNNSLYLWPNLGSPVYNLIVHRFDRTTGALYENDGEGYLLHPNPTGCQGAGIPDGGGTIQPGLRGCALRSDGWGVYITGERTPDCSNWEAFAAHVELGSGQYTDLSYAFPQPMPAQWTRARIYRNRAPNNVGQAVYFPSANGIGALTGLSNLSNVSFNATALPGLTAPVLNPGSFPGSSYFPPRFLNIGIAGDRYLSAENQAGCCGFLESHGSGVVEGFIAPQGTTSWSATSNPYGNSPVLIFGCDLVVPTGATLYLSGLELRFAPNARIIVERGGRLHSSTDLITSLSCADHRWPGIQLEGQTHASNTPTTLQGNLRLLSSTIENAVVGVRTGRFNNPLGAATSNAHYGGRVIASSTTFRNCIIGAHIERHHANTLNGGAEQANQSRFYTCQFLTDYDWPGGMPDVHILLNDVNGVRVYNSGFRNETLTLFDLFQRGWGIRAMDAAFICEGDGGYTTNSFQNLTGGVLAWLPDPSEAYTVNAMGFHNNIWGIFDLGCKGSRITRNQFLTQGNQEPLGIASTGLALFGSELFTVERNSFTDQGDNVPSIGIWFAGDTDEEDEIYDNEFTDLNAGCLVQGRHAAFGGVPSIVPGLQMRCGDHLNNWVDQLIMDQAYIRHNQGLGDNVQRYANNRFFSAVSCDPATSPSFHPYVQAVQNYPLYVNYFFYGNTNNPELRPDCIEDEQGNPMSETGDWFYDLHFQDQEGTVFNKEVHCDDGALDLEDIEPPGSGGVVQLTAQYYNKQTELNSAWASYLGAVDQDNRLDLLEAIEHQPWHPSHYLRDQLLAHHPLSDEVIKAAILRDEPLDAWHLTQVLIDNSRLSPWVWQLLDSTEVLPPYFYDLLGQMQGGGSARQVLEQEIVLRQQQKTRLQRQLLHLYATDTTLLAVQDSVFAVWHADTLYNGTRGMYLMHLWQHDFSAAEGLAPELLASPATESLVELGRMYAAAQGDWQGLSANDRDDLMQMAFTHAPSAGPLAWGALLLLNELDSLPLPELPGLFKSMRPRTEYRSHEATLPTLGVLPNPARDRIAYTYGDGLEHGVLEIFDAQGRLMRTIPLNGRRGLAESDVRGWSEGLYVVRLMLEGRNLGTAKFNVVQ